MEFTQAIVKTPGKSLVDGLSTAGMGLPDYEIALSQHREYIKALEDCGLQVRVLEADERFLNATLLEDVALLTPHCAIVLNPGTPSRKGETEGIDRVLAEWFDPIYTITDPGTVEGGDILRVEDHFYIGLTGRTNQTGAEQVIAILEGSGLGGSLAPVRDMLHLKTGIAYLGDRQLVACGGLTRQQAFQGFRILEVDPEEAYAANCLEINGTVILPAGFTKIAAGIQELGYPLRTVDVSEFRKLDGGLSCLSLRF